MDKRIKRTRRLLGNALIELLQEQPYHQITIRQITDRADVAYSTFFRNFENIEDLLLKHLQVFLEDLVHRAKTIQEPSFRRQSLATMRLVFEHVAKNRAMHTTLFQTPAASPTLKQFKQTLITHNLELSQSLYAIIENREVPLSLIITNTVTQLFGMIEWWINQDFKPDAATMATYYEQLVTIPTWQYLLGEDTAFEQLGIPKQSNNFNAK